MELGLCSSFLIYATVSLQMMSIDSRAPSSCDKRREECPPGHYMTTCPSNQGYECKQCSPDTFQPNVNRKGDACRLKKACGKPFQEYDSYGDYTTDANCKCMDGYHFENEDQRACVPNRICGKGYGQATYGYELGYRGVCERCLDKQMYSDVTDRKQKCKPLTNCEKQSRCLVKKSNGTFDNKCGPLVKDVNDCSSVIPPGGTGGLSQRYIPIIIGTSVALALIIIFIVILILLARRRRSKRRRDGQRPLTPAQLEELKQKILEKCQTDDSLCKKTIATSFRVIEDRIDRQIWTLPQELFRSHYQPGRYELLVEKYKDSQEKYAISGYLREWRDWKACTHESVTELFYCLRQCKRDDIVYEVCNKLRDEVDISFDLESNLTYDGKGSDNRAKDSLLYDITDILLPCLRSSKKKQDLGKSENSETTNKLLEEQRYGEMERNSSSVSFPGATYPSAPLPDDSCVAIHPKIVEYNKQFSCPVQCTT